MTMLLLVILLLWLSNFSDAQVHRDQSFENMCKAYQGILTPMNGLSGNLRGDTCEVTFPHGESTLEGAQRYCEDNVPFHITSAKNGSDTVTCTAEATVTCDNGWDQFFGRCYQIQKTLKSFKEAEGICKKAKSGGRIAFIHREALAFLWKEYYNKVSRIWVQAGPVISENLIYDKGPNLLLAFDGHPFGLPANSFAKVDGSKVEAMVLCESDPMITRAEANYIAKRYSEIYYPVFSTEKAMMVRTSSANSMKIQNNTDKYCLNVLRAFVNTEQQYVQSAIVDKVFLEEMNTNAAMSIVRTSYQNTHHNMWQNLQSQSCKLETKVAEHYKMNRQGILNKQSIAIDKTLLTTSSNECDLNSVGFKVQDKTKLELMSDAVSAPMYCQMRFVHLKYSPCEAGYLEYKRKNGMIWCHKLVTAGLMRIDRAKQRCKELGGHLTGFEDKDEYNKLVEHIKATLKVPVFYVWIGAERRAACMSQGSGRNRGHDQYGACSRERVFEWLNNVAPNPPNTEGLWKSDLQPDYYEDTETFLEISYEKDEQGINDIHNKRDAYAFCGKEAKVAETEDYVN